MSQKITFITFGGPTQNYHDAVARLCNQAKKFPMITKIIGYTEKDLHEDLDFWKNHGTFITNNPRGYGYWIWKPYLIFKTLKQIDNDDLLLYLDCGSELQHRAIDDFYKKINLVNMHNIIGTEASSDDIMFTKADLVKQFNLINSRELLSVHHMQAGAVFMKKTDQILKLYEDFYNICSTDYHNIDDTPSIIPNDSTFIDHRHDQSIFNLLVKTRGFHNYLMGPVIDDRSTMTLINDKSLMCIWLLRNISGTSLLT